MDQVDVDCASCGYVIKDFSTVVSVPCGHGVIHYNCSYFNNECSVCESKLTADEDMMQFRPSSLGGENNGQFVEIVRSLNEVKTLLNEQKKEQEKSSQVIEELNAKLKTQDETILRLQKEVYELKLEKVEKMRKELQEKLSNFGD